MVVLLKKNPDPNQVDNLVAWLKGQNLQVHMSEGTTQTIMGLIGDTTSIDIDLLKALDIVEDVKRHSRNRIRTQTANSIRRTRSLRSAA